MRHAVRATLVAALLATGTGCSAYDRLTTSDFSRQEPEKVVAAAVAAMSDLTSLRATGQVLVEGRSIFVDIAMDDRGRCSGTMRTAEGRVALRRVGRAAWFKGDESFFSRTGSGATLPSRALSQLATSWVRADAPPLLELCDLDAWVDVFTVPAKGARGTGRDGARAKPPTAADLANVTMEEDDDLGTGVRAVHLTPEPGHTVWIRSDAPHHVLRLEEDGREGGALSFSDFDLPVDVEPPPADEVVRP